MKSYWIILLLTMLAVEVMLVNGNHLQYQQIQTLTQQIKTLEEQQAQTDALLRTLQPQKMLEEEN